jgi:hypothetical protein
VHYSRTIITKKEQFNIQYLLEMQYLIFFIYKDEIYKKILSFTRFIQSRKKPFVARITDGENSRARIFKLLRSPRINSKEPIPPGCVAWRAGVRQPFS